MNPHNRLLRALLATAFFALRGAAQVPQINQPLVPAAAVPESSGLTLTVSGTGFTTSSVVYWNGSPRVTTVISGTKLSASINAADADSPSTGAVTVVNPNGGICTSSRGTFQCPATSNVAYFDVTTPTSAVSFARTDYPAGTTAYSVVTGDFNHDGKLDLAVPNYHGSSVSIFLGRGDGTFQPALTYAAGPYPASIAIGDFNNDGNLDVVVTNQFSASVSILLGNGNGTFQPAVSYGAGFGPVSVAVGDLNGDGKLDLAIADFNTTAISVLLGNGDGTFQPPATYSAGTGPARVAIADFNADGKPDIVVANGESNYVSVLLGIGDGTFQAPINSDAAGTMSSMSVADLNGDGRLDLVVAHYANTVTVLLGRGDGTFQAPVDLAAGAGAWWTTVADINGDGIPDIAVANANDNTLGVFLGNGDGTFQNATNYPTGTQPFGVIAGDFNGDGRLDLATNNAASNDISVLLQPTPTFGGYAQLTGGNVFSGNQTVNGMLSALSFVGDGSRLTGIVAQTASNALALGNVPASSYARLDVGNTFVGNQTVKGMVTAASFFGDGSGLLNLNPANLSPGTAAINISGTAAFANSALDANSLGGVPAANYARLDVNNSFAGNQNVNGSVAISQSLRIGQGGTPITSYSSTVTTFAPNTKMGPGTCAVWWWASGNGATDGDTVIATLSSSLMAANIVYSAWLASDNTVHVRICNPTGAPTTLGQGTIRVDVWKH